MWPLLIEVIYVIPENFVQIPLAENDPVIQKLFTHGTVPPLDKNIAVGHTWRSSVQRDVLAVF